MGSLRCQVHMANETFMETREESGFIKIVVLHCLNCGEVVDPLILRHLTGASPPMKDRARVVLNVGLGGSGTIT